MFALINSDNRAVQVGEVINGHEFMGVRGDRRVLTRKGEGYASISHSAPKFGTIQTTWHGPLDRRNFAKGGRFHNPVMVRYYEGFQGRI